MGSEGAVGPFISNFSFKLATYCKLKASNRQAHLLSNIVEQKPKLGLEKERERERLGRFDDNGHDHDHDAGQTLGGCCRLWCRCRL